MVKPPSSDTVARITVPSENQSIIDWFAFTVKTREPDDVIKMLGFSRSLFENTERGGMGYKSCLRFGHISVFYDGNENMGCHVEMSGQGCREFETSNHNWRDLIATIKLQNGKFTRLDIALDTVDGSLPLKKIRRAVNLGQVRSNFTSVRTIESATLSPDGLKNKSQTVYFGSGLSRCMFRLYDKAAQSGLNTETYSPFWIRFELQLREDRAAIAADEILRKQNLGYVATGIINQYLSFIDPKSDSNRSRCLLLPWWFNWLQHTDKLKITVQKALRLISQVKDHIRKQYGPSLAMIVKAVGVPHFSNFIQQCLVEGTKRLSRKHELIIQNSLLCTDLPF